MFSLTRCFPRQLLVLSCSNQRDQDRCELAPLGCATPVRAYASYSPLSLACQAAGSRDAPRCRSVSFCRGRCHRRPTSSPPPPKRRSRRPVYSSPPPPRASSPPPRRPAALADLAKTRRLTLPARRQAGFACSMTGPRWPHGCAHMPAPDAARRAPQVLRPAAGGLMTPFMRMARTSTAASTLRHCGSCSEEGACP